jgi:hypothetical protein
LQQQQQLRLVVLSPTITTAVVTGMAEQEHTVLGEDGINIYK